ncbi:MAG: hypothetical protein JXR20_05990 [Balneola sp.]
MVSLISYHLRRIKEYTQRYFYTSIFYPSSKKEILWELFVEVNKFLADLNIEYWTNYGTLLGFYREQDLIEHDIDIDFGCHDKFSSLIWSNKHKLCSKFKMHDSSSRHLGPKYYISYKGFDADIYFYKYEKDHLHTYEKTIWENYNSPIPAKYLYPLQELKINNIQTFIPNNTEEYLKTIYGNLEAGAVMNSKTGFWE